MIYSLVQLAPGAYDLLLEDEIVGSVVRSGSRGSDTVWTAELMDDRSAGKRPAPFTGTEHSFPTLQELCAWLGDPEVRSNIGRSATPRSS
nr:hypothetical protein [Microvirga zambiensis]